MKNRSSQNFPVHLFSCLPDFPSLPLPFHLIDFVGFLPPSANNAQLLVTFIYRFNLLSSLLSSSYSLFINSYHPCFVCQRPTRRRFCNHKLCNWLGIDDSLVYGCVRVRNCRVLLAFVNTNPFIRRFFFVSLICLRVL